jgi:hypothetical protein
MTTRIARPAALSPQVRAGGGKRIESSSLSLSDLTTVRAETLGKICLPSLTVFVDLSDFVAIDCRCAELSLSAKHQPSIGGQVMGRLQTMFPVFEEPVAGMHQDRRG